MSNYRELNKDGLISSLKDEIRTLKDKLSLYENNLFYFDDEIESVSLTTSEELTNKDKSLKYKIRFINNFFSMFVTEKTLKEISFNVLPGLKIKWIATPASVIEKNKK